MAATQHLRLPEENGEQDQVYRWRLRALRQAGYTEEQADALALRHDVDLHDAVDLLRHGCAPELAYEILR